MSVRSGRGDRGYTDLHFKENISKDSPEIETLGAIEELNCHLGLARSRLRVKGEKALIEDIQHALFRMMSEISVGRDKKDKLGVLLGIDDARRIKTVLDDLEKKVALKKCFHVPGDNELSALLDISRAVARRAERTMVKLSGKDRHVNEYMLVYMNCLSDVLFVLSRKVALRRQRKVPGGQKRKPKRRTGGGR